MKKLEPIEGEVVAPPKTVNKKTIKKRIGYGAFAAVSFTVIVYFASQIIAFILLALGVILYGSGFGGIAEFLSSAKSQEIFFRALTEFMSYSVRLQFIYFALVQAVTLWATWWFLKSRNNSWKDIGMARKPAVKDVVPALITFAIYFVFLIVVTVIISALIPGIDTDQEQQLGFKGVSGALPLLMVFISLVILPPLVEEITVRGFLYTGLKTKYSQVVAMVIASSLFAVAHLQLGSGQAPLWIAAVDTFILSVFLIKLRERTGALWSGMIVHGLKNGLAFLLLFVFTVSGI